MGAEYVRYYNNYMPVGDIAVLALCFVFLIMVRRAYITRTKSFLCLERSIYVLMVTATSDILFHIALNHIGQIDRLLIYIPRFIYHLGLFLILWMFIKYFKETVAGDDTLPARCLKVATGGLVLLIAFEIIGPLSKLGFYIDEEGVIHREIMLVPFGYFFFVGIIFYMLVQYRNRFFKQVMVGIAESAVISVAVILIQMRHGQSSFTTVTYIFPIFTLLYLVHASPYDIELGAVGEDAFEELVASAKARKVGLYFMSLYLPDFEGKGKKYPPEVQAAIRHFSGKFFKHATLFGISGGHMILVADEKKDPDYKEKAMTMLQAFPDVYKTLSYEYKIIYTELFEGMGENEEAIKFIRYIQDKMPINSIHFGEEKDVERYRKYRYIASELYDINKNMDLDDSRVEVWCQPVYNIKTKTYDTAEALMRLRLPETGMVFPDEFIPIAEENHYIHSLTKIILSKTCRQIRKMTGEGYKVKRISVNFSANDLREEDFCETVEKIISDNKIPFEKVAIEITESQNEKDFELVKERVSELKDSGIKFYLDDFGTGYSNFERIMELPFDIIKFDRSLVIASGNDEKYRTMVTNLANMFNEVDYAVLYEGVEDDADEERCIRMKARYLQGYKYSKPIPIEKLTEYFDKTG